MKHEGRLIAATCASTDSMASTAAGDVRFDPWPDDETPPSADLKATAHTDARLKVLEDVKAPESGQPAAEKAQYQLWLDMDRPRAPRVRRTAASPRARAEVQGPTRQLRLVKPPTLPAPTAPIKTDAAEPVVEIARSAPSIPPFGAWLIEQTKRGGMIGELAKAVKLDRAFPTRGTIEAVRARFATVGADGDAFAALEDAEREYDRL